MPQRILTGVIGAALLLVLVYVRGLWLDIAIAIIGLTGCHEMMKAERVGGLSPAAWPVYMAAVLMLPAYWFFSLSGLFVLYAASMILIMLAIAARKDPTAPDFFGSMQILIGLLLPLSLLYPLTRINPELFGLAMLFLVLLIAMVGDTFAYFIGVLFGRHKIAPALSPKKTWEGSIAGLLGSTGSALLLNNCMGSFVIMPPLWHFALLGLIGGIAGQLGDLCASMIKRFCGVKDFGSIFPGHGGVVDRLDSILFVAFVVFGYCLLMGFV